MKKRNIVSMLLALVFAVSLVPVLPVAADAAGGSESDPVVCTSYAQFKAAMENPSITYVKISGLNDMIIEEGSSLIAGAVVTSSKTLILSGNSELTAGQGSGLCRVDSLIYVANGGNLSVKGSGSLTFNANATNAANAVIHITHDNASVFLYDGITLNGSANGYAYGRAIDLNYGNLNIWGGTYTGDTNMELVGPSSALMILDGNCRITKGQFTAYDHSSGSNECRGIAVPDGGKVSDYLQVNSGYYENGASTTVFQIFTEDPTYTPYENYGMISFKLGHAPSDSAFLVTPGQKVENGEYTAIFTGAKMEYYEGIFPGGIYPTPEGQYKVAVKIGDQWYYSSAFTVKYNKEEPPSLAFTTQPKSGTANMTEDYTFTWALNDTPDLKILQTWVPGENGWRDLPLQESPASVSYSWLFADGNVSRYRIEATKGTETIHSNEFTVTWTEDTPAFAFTTQPVSGTTNKTEDYTYTWDLNDTPDSLVIQAWFGDSWHDGSSLIGKTSDTVSFSDTISKYRIKAVKGSDMIYSNEFSVTWTEDAGDTQEPTHTVNTSSLSVRQDPDSSSSRIGGLTKGAEIVVVETQGEWSKIVYEDGYGWVMSQYLTPKSEAEQPNLFTDVSKSDPYYDAVLWAYYHDPQITDGMTDTSFGPELTVTRGQCVTFLWRAMGKPEPTITKNPFTDVPASQYYYKAVLWAVEKGITDGVTDTTFAPDATLSTQHIVTFLYRTLNPGEDGWNGEAAAWAGKDDGGKPFGVDIAVNNKTDCPRWCVVQFLYKTVK